MFALNGMHTGATWWIRRIDICGCGNAGCRRHYCSNLLLLGHIATRSIRCGLLLQTEWRVVCVCVSVSIGQTGEPCTNGCTYRDAICKGKLAQAGGTACSMRLGVHIRRRHDNPLLTKSIACEAWYKKESVSHFKGAAAAM